MTFQGAMTAIVTPMQGGSIDEGGLRSLVKYQLAGGIAGLIVNGSTGEGATLTDDEAEYALRLVVNQVSGRVPVVAGIGARSTHGAIAQAERALNVGADALLVVTPAYNKPTQLGLELHFTAVAENCTLPIILYNVPGRAAVDLLPETVAKLAQHPRIVGIKEATGSLERAAEIRALVSSDFALLSGDDLTTFDFVAQGGHGCISVASNILPRELVALIRGASSEPESAAFVRARASNMELMTVFNALFVESNPIPVKTAAAWLGVFPSAELRLPLSPLSEAGADVLEAALKGLGLEPHRRPGEPSRLGPGVPPLREEAEAKTVDFTRD